ncbi:MAG TPA: hypothetical protein P5102_15115 [Candidatus Competibacteraceae bacterium]|nr:hypothetical protein [Candidatus Competibacteraceae bacterium]
MTSPVNRRFRIRLTGLARGKAALLVLALAAHAASVWAQEIEPRAYSNIPLDVNFLIAGYGYGEGGLVTDPALPLENANLQTHTTALAYARSFGVWGQSGKFDITLPYAWISGTAEYAGQPRERTVSGLGDPRLRFSLNLYGAPALSLKEFASYQQDLIVGASVQVSIPAGQYDADKPASLKYNFHPVLYLKNKLKSDFFNFHAGKAKVGNLWTHFGHTSPIA